MAKVIFQYEDGSKKEIETMAGNNLLEVARSANVVIDAPCSGNGACGKCRVRYASGELHSKKTLHISDEDHAAGWRLACESTIEGDVTVEIPDIPIEKYQYIGNSSLAGAYAILSSTPAEKKTYELSQNMTYLELSTVPTYMDKFIACCFLPHTDATLFSNV